MHAVTCSLCIALCAMSAGGHLPVPSVEPPAASERPVDANAEHIILKFDAADGTPLEAKLSLPVERSGPVPVVFYLHGAGPRSYDNPYGYRDERGERQIAFYLDFHARHLNQRGIAFFRMSKRGCTAFPQAPWMNLDREVFGGATPTVLLADYAAALAELRKHPAIDPARIVLLGSSEGTRLAPRLALAHPDGIVGVVMTGFAADNAKDTVTWQNTVGPWRNVQHLIPAARDGRLTREEFAEATAQEASPARAVAFDALDADKNDELMLEDLTAALAPRLSAILHAIDEGNDALIAQALIGLNTAYLLDWWDAEPNVVAMLEFDLPMAIFHGRLDGTCRVEGVIEARETFASYDKSNLTVRIYDDGDHDLNWTHEAAAAGGPPAYLDVFDHIRGLVFPPSAEAQEKAPAPKHGG